MTAQRDAFLAGEGDAYFSRNQHPTGAPYTPEIPALFREYATGKVLEIGCSVGVNLAAVTKGVANGYGIDPSKAAIVNGRRMFPALTLSEGTADALAFDDASFDMVLFGFCLYLIDRPLLFKVVTEADRVLKYGGFLGLWDFDPAAPRKRIYRHRPGIWSYKVDYSRLFLANPAYSLVSKISFSIPGNRFAPIAADRVGAWLLHKSDDGYIEEADIA